ncbi:MAG: toxin-antitoxin system, antitoxin component [Clostridiales bacterium]|nr:toxin-antitoxin system, antitoxin component [Clostridiales bacterium]
MKEIYIQIADLGRRYKAAKIVLFGSRARGDHHDRSDIDIAVYGMPKENQVPFSDEINQLPTLLAFDIVFITSKTSPALLNNINKDGIILMSKLADKRAHFSDAVSRLKESIQDYENHPLTSIRDGVIQRFEFCTELAWKTTREYLLEQGYIDINSPKSVMRQAYSDHLIEDEALWLEILNDRNLTSHLYDEAAAQEIFESIKNSYVSLFALLLNKL